MRIAWRDSLSRRLLTRCGGPVSRAMSLGGLELRHCPELPDPIRVIDFPCSAMPCRGRASAAIRTCPEPSVTNRVTHRGARPRRVGVDATGPIHRKRLDRENDVAPVGTRLQVYVDSAKTALAVTARSK
jgi:hypothetical protein